MKNVSGIHPVGYRVLVWPLPVSTGYGNGLIKKTPQEQERDELAQIDGVVVEVGPQAYSEARANGDTPWCKEGDVIQFQRYAGEIRKGVDGRRYRVLNDMDIAAQLDRDLLNGVAVPGEEVSNG